MGRKPKLKIRSKDIAKKRKWVEGLIIQLQPIGLQNLTIDQLTALMKKSKSTLYEHFETKDEILELAIDTHIDAIRDYNLILIDQSKSMTERYEQFLLLMCKGVKEIKPKFLEDLQKYYPEAWLKVSAFLYQIITDQKAFYENGMEAGIFRKVSTTLLSQLDYHFIFDILINAEVYNDESVEQMVKDYLHVRFEGMLIS